MDDTGSQFPKPDPRTLQNPTFGDYCGVIVDRLLPFLYIDPVLKESLVIP